MSELTLNRTQKAEYVRGSIKYGKPFVYELQIVERQGASVQYFSVEGDEASDSKTAIQNAWKSAKVVLAQSGELQVSEREYKVTK